MEHLASHGYVIAAPVHPFDNLNAVRAADPVDVGRNLENRPRDVSFIIDTLLARAADANDSLFGRIDGDRIGVIGHSYGGYTALAVAGGSLNGPEFEQFCAEDTITTDVFDTCSVYASVVEVDGPFPADTRNADPRVSAVVAMAPPIPFLGDGVADVETPVMVIAGEVDIPINYDRHVVAYFDALPPPRYLLSYETGGHLAMTTLCAFPRQDNTPNQDCAVYSRADKRFVTAMMGRHLRDVLAYDAELASFGEGPVHLETVR
ncbi:MAG: prolyl oligopeptidase family serine peptidase [Myxococcota bacterium]